MRACENGHVHAVRRLINAGASLDCACEDGTTPLIAAVTAGHLAVVQALLSGGGPRLLDASLQHPAFTPLYLAASRGHADMVKCLLAADQPRAADPQRTPLLSAAKRGHVSVLHVLLAAGMRDVTAVGAAAAAGHAAALSVLQGHQ